MAQEKEPLGLVWQLQERVWHISRFEGFEAFGGSIRQFRASRKRKTWLATAASFSQPLVWQQQFGTRKGTTWLSLAAARAGLARLEGFEGFEGFEAFGGSIRQFRASRKKLGLPQPLVFHQKRNHLACHSLAAPRAAVARFESLRGLAAPRAGFGTFRGV